MEIELPQITEKCTAFHVLLLIWYLYYSKEAIEENGELDGTG